MKYFGVLAFVAFATFLALTEGSVTTWGYVGPRDILLHREVVNVSSKFLRVVERDVEYYPKNSNRTITAIRAVDIKSNSSGLATLKKGGPGFRNATIHLKSQRNHGLHFAIEVLGF